MADAPHALPTLSGISLLVVGASFLGATGLHLWRHRNGRQTGRGQFFNDGGAIISLIVLLCMVFDMVHPTPDAAQLVRENGILVCWAIGYAGVMVTLNLLDSARGDAAA